MSPSSEKPHKNLDGTGLTEGKAAFSKRAAFLSFEVILKNVEKLFGANGLGDKSGKASLKGPFLFLIHSVRRQGKNRAVQPERAKSLQRGEAIHSRHL